MARLETVVSRRGCFVDQPHRRKCLTMKRLCQLGVFSWSTTCWSKNRSRFRFSIRSCSVERNLFRFVSMVGMGTPWMAADNASTSMAPSSMTPAIMPRWRSTRRVTSRLPACFWRMSLAAVPGGGQAEPVCGGWAVVVGMFFSQKWMVDGGQLSGRSRPNERGLALRSRKTRQAFADRLLPLPLNTPENRKMVIRHFTNSSRGRLLAAFLAQKAEKPRAEDYSFFVEPIGVGGRRFMHARETLTSAAGMLLVRPSRRTASWNSGQTGPAARKSACRSSGRSRAASRPRFVPAARLRRSWTCWDIALVRRTP